MKEIKKDKVFQYTGKYIPEDLKRPEFVIDAFRRKILYFVGDVLLIRNNSKYCTSFLKTTERINIGDYLVTDDEGIMHKINKNDFENKYKIIK